MNYFVFLDTSSSHLLLGVACLEEDRLTCWQWNPHKCEKFVHHLQETQAPTIQNQADHVLPILKQLFDFINITVDDITFVAYGTGPGAFTGVRTSCAIAQGLCYAKSIPAVAVDSLAMLAQTYALGIHPSPMEAELGDFDQFQFSLPDIKSIVLPVSSVLVAIDARMQEVYWQGLVFHHGVWSGNERIQVTGAHLMEWAHAKSTFALVGNAHVTYESAMLPLIAQATVVQTVCAQGYAMASLAAMIYQNGTIQMASQIEPLYVRDKVALTLQERQAQGLAF